MDAFGFVSSLVDAVRPRRDGDLMDRMNYCYTVIILVISSLFVATWSFVGAPLNCWYPAYFKGWWIEYANEYCFVQNTYFLRLYDGVPNNSYQMAEHRVNIPPDIHEREHRVLPYYQWVSFVLALEALCFYLPMVLWRAGNSNFGLRVNTILTEATKTENVNADDLRDNMNVVSKFLDYYHQVEGQLNKNSRFRGRLVGSYVSVFYLFIKALYCLNVVLQFFILNGFLGMGDSSWWGFEILRDMVNGRTWHESGRFPRVTVCDFEVRELGNLHRHSVQCVLMVNMFNEKFFVFLWWWFLLIAFLNFLSLFDWLFIILTYKRSSHDFVRNLLNSKGAVKQGSSLDLVDMGAPGYYRDLDRFIKTSLAPDGVFLLKLISTNSGDTISAELAKQLWASYAKRNQDHEPENGTPSTASTRLLGKDSSPRGRPARPPTPSELERLPVSPPPRYEDSEANETNL